MLSRRPLKHLIISLLFPLTVNIAQATDLPNRAEFISQIAAMKENPRGPFSQIRWFCEDGSILPPTQRGCKALRRGEGKQYGQWSEETVRLRNQGFPVGTVYAALTPDDFERIENNPRELTMLILERFLITVDDGWVLRQARSYRGAFQADEEIQNAESLLRHLISNEDFRSKNFLLLREGARLLPRSGGSPMLTEIRAMATQIAKRDAGFTTLRNKVHGYPESSDYERIVEYSQKKRKSPQYDSYLRLADKIKVFYGEKNLLSVFIDLANRLPIRSLDKLNSLAAELRAARSPASFFLAYANSMALFREEFTATRDTRLGLALLDASLQVEQNLFAKARDLSPELRYYPLIEQFSFIEAGVQALYGSGLLSKREALAARSSVNNLRSTPLTPKRYYEELNYLSLISGWATGQLRWSFEPAVTKLQEIEPMTSIFFADQLRQSVLLFIAEDLNLLEAHALRSLGISHTMFGQQQSGDLRVLNPGVASGVLIDPHRPLPRHVSPEQSIYLVSEFEEDIPAVAGIVTARQGNMLSHVQLLARNLGVPNIVAGEQILPQLQAMHGKEIFIAATPRGRVQITNRPPRTFLELEESTKVERVTVDNDDIDFSVNTFIPLTQIRAKDSGVIAGPKAAKLGSLKEKYPSAVSKGVVLPFGIYQQMLQTDVGGGLTMEKWIDEEYAALEDYPRNSAQRQAATKRFLAEVREKITGLSLSEGFKKGLRNALETNIGPIGSYGVFVRSDTNVEDLPNFTGAGLNLTVPNVVQFDQIVQALLNVWASPFADRAFSWRQAHMTNPNDVYVSVLMLQTVPVEKSGVLITSDISTGDTSFLTVAANYGVGGAVDNQNAEVIRIDRKNGAVRLYSSATAQERKIVNPKGGISKVPSLGTERVLTEDELLMLYELAKEAEQKVPELFRSENKSAAADIEFGFLKDRLILFQIRPVVENKRVRSFLYLQELDQQIPSDELRQSINIMAPPVFSTPTSKIREYR